MFGLTRISPKGQHSIFFFCCMVSHDSTTIYHFKKVRGDDLYIGNLNCANMAAVNAEGVAWLRVATLAFGLAAAWVIPAPGPSPSGAVNEPAAAARRRVGFVVTRIIADLLFHVRCREIRFVETFAPN